MTWDIMVGFNMNVMVHIMYKYRANHNPYEKAKLVLCCSYIETNDDQEEISWLRVIGFEVSVNSEIIQF